MTPHQSWEGWSPCFWGDFARPSRRGNIQPCQIIATEKHDGIFPQMVVKRKENGTPAISGKSRLVKYYNLARWLHLFAKATLIILRDIPLILLMVQNSGEPVEVGNLSHYLQGYISQLVQDFFHQQYGSQKWFSRWMIIFIPELYKSELVLGGFKMFKKCFRQILPLPGKWSTLAT